MLFIADVSWLEQLAAKDSKGLAAVIEKIHAPSIAVASASIPALHALLLKTGAALEDVREILAKVRVVKTPSYFDFSDDLAIRNPEKYLLLLTARATGSKVLTTDPELLAQPALAVSPEAGPAPDSLIPFCNLRKQYEILQPKIEERLDRIFTHGQFINGPEIGELERACASAIGARHALGCASGTDALLLALMAYDVGPGDFVITTPFTFIATAEVVALLGARPLFVDIDPGTYNLCPQALKNLLEHPVDPLTKEAIPAEKIRGLIAVDLFGQPADYDALHATLTGREMFLIEDGAQSFGAVYKGRPSCSLGDISTTSFFPAKPLGCYGDGGMIFTDSDELATKMRQLLNHGQTKRYTHTRIGINGRLDTLQAGILLAKFETFTGGEISQRNSVAAAYAKALAPASQVGLPTVRQYDGAEPTISAWAQFSILVEKRETVQEKLAAAGVPTAVHYPVPLHMQPAFADLGYGIGDFPVSERVSASIMSLPMDPWKTTDEIERVAAAVATATTSS